MNKELALILDFKFLNDSNILLQEFLTLLTIKFPDIGYNIVDEVKNELQNKNFIKIIQEQDEEVLVIREKGNLLIDYLLIEGLNPKDTEKQIVKKSKREIHDGLDEFVKEYRNLWKGLKIGSMGSHNTCFDKLSRWFSENPSYTKDDVLNAAKLYIKSLDNYQYLQQADYFIYKKDGKEESSRLSSFIDESPTAHSDWTSLLQ